MNVVVTHFVSLVLRLQRGLPPLLKLVPFVEMKNLSPFAINKLTELSGVFMCSVLTRIKGVSGRVK